MIRSSKHILKYQTNNRSNILQQIYTDYRSCLHFYIHLIVTEQLSLGKFSPKKLPDYSNIKHSQWKQVIYKQASEIVRSNIKYQDKTDGINLKGSYCYA